MKKIISILSLSLIVSFTSLYAEVEGYQDLKFGLTKREVGPIHKKYCGYVSSHLGVSLSFISEKNLNFLFNAFFNLF